MGFDVREISEASRVPVATVYRAVKNGKLDLNDVLSLSWYVVGNLMLSGILFQTDENCYMHPERLYGVDPEVVPTPDMGTKEKFDPASIVGVRKGIPEKVTTDREEEENEENGEEEGEESGNEFSDEEERKIVWLERSRKVSREKAEGVIIKNREAYMVDHLDEEMLDGIR